MGVAVPTVILIRELLRFEDGPQEEVLQLLIGEIDAQLLE